MLVVFPRISFTSLPSPTLSWRRRSWHARCLSPLFQHHGNLFRTLSRRYRDYDISSRICFSFQRNPLRAVRLQNILLLVKVWTSLDAAALSKVGLYIAALGMATLLHSHSPSDDPLSRPPLSKAYRGDEKMMEELGGQLTLSLTTLRRASPAPTALRRPCRVRATSPSL